MDSILRISILGLFLFSLNSLAQTNWQTELEAKFDIVETFDNYEDWIPELTSDLPQYLSGGTSETIQSVSYWSSTIPVNERAAVITTYPGHSVRNSKAMRLNWMGDGVGNQEASTIRYYFGDGTETSGYNDFYLFGMVYIPSDKFPTEVNNVRDPGRGNSVYGFNVQDGKHGVWMSSAKMIGLSVGFIDANNWAKERIRTSACRWGWTGSMISMAVQKGTSHNYQKRSQFSHFQGESHITELGDVNIINWLDRPFYFEAHIKRESAIGEFDGSFTLTFYNMDGSGETTTVDAQNISFLYENAACPKSENMPVSRGNQMKFNRLVIESNWRAQNPETRQDSYLRCGNHKLVDGTVDRPLHCSSYYDDLIIDDNRVSPIYFAMLNNQTIPIRADVDQNLKINTTDAMLTLRSFHKLDMSATSWHATSTTGDVNCDNASNDNDAVLILRHSLGLEMSGTGWCGD